MNKIITISREYGAGGHSIGRRVAEELGIPFYDRDILKETVKTSGFDPDMVEHDQEDVSSTNFFLKSICSFSDASFSDTQDAIHDVQKAVILHFAKEGPCVILGRCADEILREAGVEALNVFMKKIRFVDKVELLGYHTMAVEKYGKLGITYRLKGVPPMDSARLMELQKLIHKPAEAVTRVSL